MSSPENSSAEPKRTPSFIFELELKTSFENQRQLLVRMDCARQVYNACLGESLRRLKLMRESKTYQNARKMKNGKERTAEFREARLQHEFSEYALHAYAKQFNHSWLGQHLDSLTIQKMASRAFGSVEQYAYNNRGKPRFKSKSQIPAIEGKNNTSGIIWNGKAVEWSVQWKTESGTQRKKLILPAKIKQHDLVHKHGLQSRVKYVRLVMRKIRGKNRFFAQLVCEGAPLQKIKNSIGEGAVGLDIGPSTIAIVSQEKVRLEVFCDQLKSSQRKIRVLQRKLDRSRRANNQNNYEPNGTIKKGKKTWKNSKSYFVTKDKLAEINRKLAAHRKSLHGQMVNDIFRMGDVVNLEKLSYVSFQRIYGKSIGMRSPGAFVATMRRKAVSAGVAINEYDPRKTRHSQLCHNCGTIEKKPLSQRWHDCACGVRAQRDLYSAFLAMNMEGATFNADNATKSWTQIDNLLQAAVREKQLANGGTWPASFGLNSRSQSQPPAKSGKKHNEMRDAVRPQSIVLGEPARVALPSFSTRTSRL